MSVHLQLAVADWNSYHVSCVVLSSCLLFKVSSDWGLHSDVFDYLGHLYEDDRTLATAVDGIHFHFLYGIS